MLILAIALPLVASAQAAPATGFEGICQRGANAGIAACVKAIYLFSLGFGSILALLMLVLSGYRYMTAAGNAEQVQNAKDGFEDAMKGLVIIFTAFILLFIINPDLVKFGPLQFPSGGVHQIPPGGPNQLAFTPDQNNQVCATASGDPCTMLVGVISGGQGPYQTELTWISDSAPTADNRVIARTQGDSLFLVVQEPSGNEVGNFYSVDILVRDSSSPPKTVTASFDFSFDSQIQTLIIVNVPTQPSYRFGDEANISFIPAPGGQYNWSFNNCVTGLPGDLEFIDTDPPRITGTVSEGAVAGTYHCRILGSGQGRAGEKLFDIVISP